MLNICGGIDIQLIRVRVFSGQQPIRTAVFIDNKVSCWKFVRDTTNSFILMSVNLVIF